MAYVLVGSVKEVAGKLKEKANCFFLLSSLTKKVEAKKSGEKRRRIEDGELWE